MFLTEDQRKDDGGNKIKVFKKKNETDKSKGSKIFWLLKWLYELLKNLEKKGTYVVLYDFPS